MASAQVAFSVAASPGHDLAGHYECAKRIPAIMEALQQARLTPDAQPETVWKAGYMSLPAWAVQPPVCDTQGGFFVTADLRQRQPFSMHFSHKNLLCQDLWACIQALTQTWRHFTHHHILQLLSKAPRRIHIRIPPQEALYKFKFGQHSVHDIVMQIMEIPGARTASKAELEAVHSPAHIDAMRQKALQDAPCVVADFEETPDNTTYMAKSSFDEALQVHKNFYTSH